MKKITVLIIVALLCMVLVGCSSTIDIFKIEDIDLESNFTYSDRTGPFFQLVNSFSNENELKTFFDNNSFGTGTMEKLARFNKAYFEENNLLVTCFVGDKNDIIKITSLEKKQSELFVVFETIKTKTPEKRQYNYNFITLSKKNVEGINKFSYKINTLPSATSIR